MRRFSFAAVALSLVLSACGMNMYDQPKVQWEEKSEFLPGNVGVQPIPEGTVSRQRGGVNESFYTGLGAEGLIAESPIPVTYELLERGQERYNIYCSPCHNFNGNGLGVIVQKGMVQPSSFHEQRLQDQPIGYFYSAITNGFGRMYSYASRVPPEDRWAISSYIKALQLSQNATLSDVPEEFKQELNPAGEEAPADETPAETETAARSEP